MLKIISGPVIHGAFYQKLTTNAPASLGLTDFCLITYLHDVFRIHKTDFHKNTEKELESVPTPMYCRYGMPQMIWSLGLEHYAAGSGHACKSCLFILAMHTMSIRRRICVLALGVVVQMTKEA